MVMEHLGTSVPHELINQVETQHAGFLNEHLRYDRFRLAETPEEWVALLGEDVLLATHPNSTAELWLHMAQYHASEGQAFSDELIIQIFIAAKVHDWGEIKTEGMGVGDVSFDKKTEDDEKIEVVMFNRICDTLPAGPGVDLIRKAYFDVAQKKDGDGEIFNLVERLGYWLTALRAFRGEGGRRIQNWAGLTGNVLSNQTKKLLEYSSKYAFVRHMLDLTGAEVTNAFTQILALETVPVDKAGDPSYDLEKLTAAHDAWESAVRHSS